MKNRLLISFILIILIGGVVLLFRRSPTQEQAAAPETGTPATLAAPIPATNTLAPDPDIPQADPTPEAPEESIPPEIIAQMETIQEQVIQMRGLQPNGTFSREFRSIEQLRQDFMEIFEEELSEFESWEYTLALSIFGLLNEEFDIYDFHVNMLTEQVAGYYDHETDEMVLIAGGAFGGPERLTYSHEYTHALQDQNFDIENGLGYNDQICLEDSERCAAIEALLEGDATLSETQWFLHNATDQDHADLMAFYSDMEMPAMNEAPAFLGQDLLFPYLYGYDFVQHLFDQGGWEAVDQAYQNPPVSTEQILHPERYPADAPVPVDTPDLLPILGDGWELVEGDVMGEWYTYLILAFGLDESARINEAQAAQAAEGWEGDSYAVYHHDQEGSAVMLFRVLWESQADADEFADIFSTYATRRFGDPIDQNNQTSWVGEHGMHSFRLEDSFTTWLFAPDQSTTKIIWQSIP